MLKNHADLPAQRHQRVFIKPANVDLIDQHTAAGGLFQTIDGANQRRFARPAAANDAEDLPALNRQVDARQRIHRALAPVIGFTHADKAHMGAAEFRVQFGLGRTGRLGVEPRASNGHAHVSLPSPAGTRCRRFYPATL